MRKLILAVIAVMTLGMGIAAAQTSGVFHNLANNRLPSAPYTYSDAGG